MSSTMAMGTWGTCMLLILLQIQPCKASVQHHDILQPGFQGSQMDWIDNNGCFLLSNDSRFAFGFQPINGDVTLFLLVVIHLDSNTVVWSANRDSPVKNSDKFIFTEKENVSLKSGEKSIWSPDTGGKPVSVIRMQNSGNLVLLGEDNSALWQSFSHPTDTLLSGHVFTHGMSLTSNPGGPRRLSYSLKIESGDMFLFAGFRTPLPYWSMSSDARRVVNENGGNITTASIEGNSWNFYGDRKALLWLFIISTNDNLNSTWIAVLGNNGLINFRSLVGGGSSGPSSGTIPSDSCETPEHCDPFNTCASNTCSCPSGLLSRRCKVGIDSHCGGGKSNESMDLIYAGDDLKYAALDYVAPFGQTDLDRCKAYCAGNCSCLVLFFNNSTGDCFLFDDMGSFQSDSNSSYAAYVKVSKSTSTRDGGGGGNKNTVIVVVISAVTILVVFLMVFGSYRWYSRMKGEKRSPEASEQELSEEDTLLETLSGMPARYSYKDLQTATNNFSEKLGQGGFGSVYYGVLKDGTRVAVKKLEGIGQGKKEFRAEVSIIGSIHHVHLVRLKGFCAEGSLRLLAYEYMAKGSLDKWIFRRNPEAPVLDWAMRFNMALGTAKGLAYLHEDCDRKIVHCDIKPENVLLDDKFQPKVSDFGLAKLMTREQSHVFTTLRGTRGYLAPEWITNYAISEKSDVYSYGMVLLEIIGGRKNYDPQQSSEKAHFPSYAFKMMEEGKPDDVVDYNLKCDPDDESICIAIKVALWCIQEDMSLRPSMAKVVQMLEGISPVTQPPTSSLTGSRLYASLFKNISEGTGTGTSSGPSDCNSDTFISAVRLSGPR